MDIYVPRKYIFKHTKVDDSLYITTRDKEPKVYDDIVGFNGHIFTYEDPYNYIFDEIKHDLFDAYLDMKMEKDVKYKKKQIKRKFIK